MSATEKTQNFSEIFENTFNDQTDFGYNHRVEIPMEWSSDLDPMHLSYLLGTVEIGISKSQIPFKNPYLKYKKRHQQPNHILKIEHQNAFDLINFNLSPPDQLAPNFNSFQLKRSYKKAALRTHPDCGGSHESFLQLKSCYELLLAFLDQVK